MRACCPARLRSWITSNEVFFNRNQGQIPDPPIDPQQWRLTVDGAVKQPLNLYLEQLKE
jgi:DMSO/TMAO reductase YedYZ molybdopterin-dependent catalytic subunit